MHYTMMSSDIGELLLGGDADRLHLIGFPAGKGKVSVEASWQRSDTMFDAAKSQLREYFSGERKVFDLALSPSGTEFQLEVLAALQKIPFGATCSYQDIAQLIGRPKAVRAVGAANGRNPLPIVIPCHRVIGANGSLTGFGGGLETKHWLLKHEGSLPAAQQNLF